MSPRIALITGVAGFTGYHLLTHLQEACPELAIVGIDRNTPAYSNNHKFTKVNLLDSDAVLDLIGEVQPTHVFHLAGLNFSDDPKLFYEINVIATMNLLEAIRKKRHQIDPKVLLVGSSAEYGIVNANELPICEENPLRPINHYGVSKVAQNLLGFQYYKNYGLKVIRVRPFNLIGPGQSADFVCGALAKQIVEVEKGYREPEILVGNLEPERDFVDVRDVVSAYLQLITAGKNGEIYNIGSGKSYSIRDVLEILRRKANAKIETKQDKGRMRASDIPRQVGNISKITGELGWVPKITLEESLQDMLGFFRAVL